MHYLHKILVYIPDLELAEGSFGREELIDAVRSLAETRTESFEDIVYDWRETFCAGRWQSAYPENVLLASEDPERFAKELEGVLQNQSDSLQEALRNLPSRRSLAEVVKLIWNRDGEASLKEFTDYMAPYYFHKAASLLHGEYISDSLFYNTHDYTARLYPEDIRKIKAEPNNWALALFDYHN